MWKETEGRVGNALSDNIRFAHMGESLAEDTPTRVAANAHSEPSARVLLQELRSSCTTEDIEMLLAESGFAGTYMQCTAYLKVEDQMLTAEALISFCSETVADEFAGIWNNHDIGGQLRQPRGPQTEPAIPEQHQQQMVHPQRATALPAMPQGSCSASSSTSLAVSSWPMVEQPQDEVPTSSCSPEEIMANGFTSLMLQNLPYRISQLDVRGIIDNGGYADTYDFFHLPHSVRAGVSHGYAFINFNSAPVAARFARDFAGTYAFTTASNRKPLVIALAAVQGFDALVHQAMRRKLHRIRNPHLRPFIRSAPLAASGTSAASRPVGHASQGTARPFLAPAGPVPPQSPSTSAGGSSTLRFSL
mmetsp:Transcript_27357/g.63108  ORF Transcript_27357/g.63108 Transcript_27357/m.63108 type:complete len:361 (-) Transcript_27357:302-1384(-)